MIRRSGKNRDAQPRKSIWVYAASGLLTAFTVFVLLDTFAIGRVQRIAEASDYSSIVAAQNDSATAGSASDQALSNPNGISANGVTPESATADAASDAADADEDATSSSSARNTRRHAHHATHNGKPSRPSNNQPSSSSSSSLSTTDDASTVVAGAASAQATGTRLGSYSDDNMQISVTKLRAYDTDIYVADVQVSSAAYLKTALAQGSYGRNLKDTTSNMAEQSDAILAINGDYYGFRDYGYVLRNGILYRDTAANGTDALVVYGDGTMDAASQDETSAEQLKEEGAWQILSFGPVLVDNGQIAVAADEEVGQSMSSNPRTAIGMISPLHYVVVVSDGRTDNNQGLSLYELAQVLIDNGATFAYNLDGGGSTTLYFQGEVLNNPSSGNRDGERQVSDIVYFG